MATPLNSLSSHASGVPGSAPIDTASTPARTPGSAPSGAVDAAVATPLAGRVTPAAAPSSSSSALSYANTLARSNLDSMPFLLIRGPYAVPRPANLSCDARMHQFLAEYSKIGFLDNIEIRYETAADESGRPSRTVDIGTLAAPGPGTTPPLAGRVTPPTGPSSSSRTPAPAPTSFPSYCPVASTPVAAISQHELAQRAEPELNRVEAILDSAHDLATAVDNGQFHSLDKLRAATETCHKEVDAIQEACTSITHVRVKYRLDGLATELEELDGRVALCVRKASSLPSSSSATPPASTLSPGSSSSSSPPTTSASTSSSSAALHYLRFEGGGCVLRPALPSSNASIYELHAELKKLGLLEHIHCEIATDDSGCPIMRIQLSGQDLQSLFLSFPSLSPYLDVPACDSTLPKSCMFGRRVPQVPSHKGLVESRPEKRNQLERLLAEARHRNDSLPTPVSVPCTISDSAMTSNRSIVREVFSQGIQGIVCGESHSHDNSKQFVLEAIRSRQVKTVYLEHICYDALQPMLDAYWKSSSDKMPLALMALLEGLDMKFRLRPEYSYTAIVREAKRHGVRIVGIDTTLTQAAGTVRHHADRLMGMNQGAQTIVEHEQRQHPGNFIVLTGAAHSSTWLAKRGKLSDVDRTIVGLADRLRCLNIVIQDVTERRLHAPRTNVSGYPYSLGSHYEGSVGTHMHLHLERHPL